MLSASEVKATLKEAREALKNKHYDTATKHCKQILAQDGENYMALVLMGASLQESDSRMVTQPKSQGTARHSIIDQLFASTLQAATFLRKAVKQTDNNLVVALQGLSLCAEPGEMPDICRQLIELAPYARRSTFFNDANTHICNGTNSSNPRAAIATTITLSSLCGQPTI